MKKLERWTSLLLAAMLLLAACKPAGDTAISPAANADGNTAVTTPGAPAERQLPESLRIALGTLKLEDTPYAVSAEQAAQVLPLWKAVRSLGSSETAATEEIQAVQDQIRETMTADQLQAIQDMELSMQDLSAIAEQLGLDIGGAGRFGEMTPEMQATAQAARESGQFPPAGFGDGSGPGGGGGFGGGGAFIPGGGPGGETGLSPEAQQTAIAERRASGGAGSANLGINPAVLEVVIQFLEAKIE